MTLSALARYPEIQQLDCVEIEPAVIRAAPFLRPLNRDVLKDPRVHMIFDDARNFLATTHNHYDVIVSEPSNPWIEGIGALFTREFYRAAQSRLNPGGIFVQWVQSYSLYPHDLRTIFATFLSQFHDVTLWHGVRPDLILVAGTPPSNAMVQRMGTLWADTALRDDFQQMGIERPEGLFGFYLLDDAALRRFAAGARVDSDDRMSLEYEAPHSLLVRGLVEENLKQLQAAQPAVELAGMSGEERESVLAASAITALNGGDAADADRFESSLDQGSPREEPQIAFGRSALARADYAAAMRFFEAAATADPQSLPAAWGIAETNRLSGQTELARQQLLSILARDPKDLRALGSLEQIYSDTSRPLDASFTQRALIAADPHADADAYAELGEMLKRAGRLDEAVTAMNECLARDPYNFQTHLNLGQIFDVEHKYREARQTLEFAERFFPDVDPQIYALLYEADKGLGDSGAAAEAVRSGLRIFPGDPDLLKLSQWL
jgi:tetratricopeptide (TPR) repeat protein